MQRQWQTTALGMAAVMIAGVALAAGREGNQGSQNKNGGGSQFRVQNGNHGGNGGLKLSNSFKPQVLNSNSGGNAPRIGGQTFKPQILNQNLGPKNVNGGLGIHLGPAVTGKPKPTPIRTQPNTTIGNSIKKIGLNGSHNGPKFDKIGIKPADLGIKIGAKPLDPSFNQGKPIGVGVIANGGNNGGSQNSPKKNNGLGIGLGIGLGVIKHIDKHHHNHCHDFHQPNYCWPSSCVSIHCGNYVSPQPIYCLPPVQVIEVVTVIEMPVVVEQVVVAPPQPELDPTLAAPGTDAVALQPIATDPQAFPPPAPAGDPDAPTRSLETPVSTPISEAAAAPVDDANLVRIPVGGPVELKGKDLGVEAGQVVVQIGDLMLPATLKEWKTDSVTATLPRMGVVNPTKALLHLVKPDGKFASSLPCLLIAPPQPPK